MADGSVYARRAAVEVSVQVFYYTTFYSRRACFAGRCVPPRVGYSKNRSLADVTRVGLQGEEESFRVQGERMSKRVHNEEKKAGGFGWLGGQPKAPPGRAEPRGRPGGWPPQRLPSALRAAEELVLGEVSTGAENDLRQVTTLARQMVAMYGMRESLGLAHCAERQNPFAGVMPDGHLQRDCSEQTAREIDQEVKGILGQSYTEAKAILSKHREQLDLVAGELLRRETLDGKSFRRLLQNNGHPAGREPAPGSDGGTAGKPERVTAE